jgi:hypothetical protein
MYVAVQMAQEAMGPQEMAAVVDFNKKVRAGTINATAHNEESEDPMAEFWSMWSQPFRPNLFNTVIFLVETAQVGRLVILLL